MAWNAEAENGSRVKVIEKPHKTALKIVGLEDRDISNTLHFPASRRELLDLLQVKLVVFLDRIEIKAVFSIQPIDCQKYTSPSQGEGD